MRTDKSFRERYDRDHHKVDSVIERLPVDMIRDFPTCDPLHLLHLGVMKKCILIWMHGTANFEHKLTKENIIEIDELIGNLNGQIVSDIHRSIKKMKDVKRWKGSELQTILSYVGIVLFKKFLRNEEYVHFLYLFCAVRLCSCQYYKNCIALAEELFNEYIENYINLYGIDSIGSNVHNLCHIVNDVKRFGNLNQISTYPFENCLGHLKSKLRRCNKPLEQISRRIYEMDSTDLFNNFEITEMPLVKFPRGTNPETYEFICLGPRIHLSTRNSADCWFLTKDRKIVEMIYVSEIQNKYFIYGRSLKTSTDFFTQPFSSSRIDIYESNGENNEASYFAIDAIKAKLLCLKYDKVLVSIPLLHTLDFFQK